MRRVWTAGLMLFLIPIKADAGLYYTGEPTADLPSQWRGFLLDQRSLRLVGAKPKKGQPLNPMRKQYLKKAEEFEKSQKTRALTPVEKADLGAIYLRLGETAKAVAHLRKSHRAHPNHFQIAANLGTAWQMHGDLQQALLALRRSVRLAPGKWLLAEKYHLKLVLLRVKEPKGASNLDNLFDVRYAAGEYQPGTMPKAEKKKLPSKAVAITQQLCLWLPYDARLLWQLAEIANGHGDLRYAANMMDGCVTAFGLQSRTLRRRRQLVKAAVAKLPKQTIGDTGKHKTHVAGVLALSKRPLLTKFDQSSLPPVKADGLNRLPWPLVNETEIGKKFRPSFARYLKELDGKKITITGFMQPFSEELDLANFMLIEYPVGCWYCEMPELTGIIYVEAPRGKSAAYTRSLIRITGTFHLNATDPEEFLYAIRNATVGELD